MKKRTKIYNRSKPNKGGKVISSGGFGCIFQPALQCKTKKRKSSDISKLMLKRNALKEYEEIEQIKSTLQHIPDFEKYFLINGFSLCEPEVLTKQDLTQYENKCRALQKKEITTKNIQEHLPDLLALNMPYGGVDIGDFIKTKESEELLSTLNETLIDLLIHGILPMNRSHIYHCDIKESNVLVKQDPPLLSCRLIDWGLSMKYQPKQKIPPIICNRPFQYNLPFSVILFNTEFLKKYKSYLQEHTIQDYDSLQQFVMEYIPYWIKYRGAGHMKLILKNIQSLFLLDKKEEHGYSYIIEYITQILYTFTKEDGFHLEEYFQIFVQNVDIWGFVMIYIPFIQTISQHYNELSEVEHQLFEKLKYIVLHFLFDFPDQPIPIKPLIQELTQLTPLMKPSLFTNKLSLHSILKSKSNSNSNSKARSKSKSKSKSKAKSSNNSKSRSISQSR